MMTIFWELISFYLPVQIDFRKLCDWTMDSKPVSSDMARERTFQYDDDLPSLPVPKLEDTIKNYLDSGRYKVKNKIKSLLLSKDIVLDTYRTNFLEFEKKVKNTIYYTCPNDQNLTCIRA